jgi:hypothetical protein
MTDTIEPVTDWHSDYEILDPAYVVNHEERWAGQRYR